MLHTFRQKHREAKETFFEDTRAEQPTFDPHSTAGWVIEVLCKCDPLSNNTKHWLKRLQLRSTFRPLSHNLTERPAHYYPIYFVDRGTTSPSRMVPSFLRNILQAKKNKPLEHTVQHIHTLDLVYVRTESVLLMCLLLLIFIAKYVWYLPIYWEKRTYPMPINRSKWITVRILYVLYYCILLLYSTVYFPIQQPKLASVTVSVNVTHFLSLQTKRYTVYHLDYSKILQNLSPYNNILRQKMRSIQKSIHTLDM